MMGDTLGSSSRVIETFNIETSNKMGGTECLVTDNTDMEVRWRNVAENNVEITAQIIFECL